MRGARVMSLGLIAVLVGCGSSASEDEPDAEATFEITGSATFNSASALVTDGSCFGLDAYEGLRLGAQVVVTDELGAAVGVGEVTEATGKDAGRVALEQTYECSFAFEVPDVEDGGRLYGVSVGPVEPVIFNRSDLESPIQITAS